MTAPMALGLTVAGLLGAFGLGAALLPDSVTGKGVAAGRGPATVPVPAGEASREMISVEPPPPVSPSFAGSTEAPSPAPPPKAKPSNAPPPPPKPKPKPKPAPAKPKVRTPEVGADQESQENEVIRLVNLERGKAGCGTVRMDAKLRTAIRLHVQELGTHGDLYISHDSDDGRTFVERAKAQGYTDPGGENVARGQNDAADVMQGWMTSDGHRANILNCSFKAIGVGVIKGVDKTLVWGQIFGRS